MFPYRDDNPRVLTPVVTTAFVVITSIVWLLIQGAGLEPRQTFPTGSGRLHFLGNMWFLWVFGDNVEDSMGHGRFVVFYLVCGVLAALGQVLSSPASSIPLVGASGAISGVMGAYLVLYPKVKVHTLIFLGFFITRAALPAWAMLGIWGGVQLISSLVSPSGSGGTAFLAHVAGFVAGMVLIRFFQDPVLVAKHRSRAVVRSWA